MGVEWSQGEERLSALPLGAPMVLFLCSLDCRKLFLISYNGIKNPPPQIVGRFRTSR